MGTRPDRSTAADRLGGVRHASPRRQLWQGLRRRGLLEADVVGDCWFLHWVAAEWMLTSPSLATQMNATYERLYPGALQNITGMTMRELTEPKRWERALT